MLTICGNGSPQAQSGAAVHIYRATAPMTDRFSWTPTANF